MGGQQAFDSGPQRRITRAGVIQKMPALADIRHLDGFLEKAFFPLEDGTHFSCSRLFMCNGMKNPSNDENKKRQTPTLMVGTSQALAKAHWLSTVRSPILRCSAISWLVSPPKNLSVTMRAFSSSSTRNRSSASSINSTLSSGVVAAKSSLS